jgi:hypothetical protein
MTGEEPLSAEESDVPVIAVFTCDAGKTASPRVRDARMLEGPKSINIPCSCIRQPRRPNSCDKWYVSFVLSRSHRISINSMFSKSSFLFMNERAPRGYHQPSHSIRSQHLSPMNGRCRHHRP